jgi:TetR/AcrR family transcriptional regulator, transcriptional repressor for nem operon
MTPTRDQIIELADQLIRKNGFNGFSYTDISIIMDIRNAAIHYHFPSKSDLGEAVLAAEIAKIATERRDSRDLPGDAQLKKLVTTFYQHCGRGQLCLNGALTPDYYTFTPSMQEGVKRMCADTLDWASHSLEKGRLEDKLHFEGAAADQALLLMSTLLSSLLLSRVLGRSVFDRALDQMLQEMRVTWSVADLPRDHRQQ